ncbi:MAG: SIS domain-containing protein [Candidatus Cloacimonetes bacterium]|nr:SIS domain-containing protein [Candidatus Cloacimonadota bacterium]MBS3766999.1 SIS domain-containing protein [Candidatus Cloacimonadota bacterium]
MNFEKIKNLKIKIPLPVFGLGCGVLGMNLAKISVDLGKYASKLLRSLEYRGYDSTGAIFQDGQEKTTVLKDVGAPSTLVETLGIDKQTGKIFCGQVRWATFGTVDKKNAQPHEVRCKRHIYGAHNGNITNTARLKEFLLSEGHNVVSDNDGEMLVHTVEHYFDNELEKIPKSERKKADNRKMCMRRAIVLASQRMVGSYAAVVVDPKTEIMYAIKSGSSLYFGLGKIDGGNFCLASSDLTAILKFTKALVNLREGEFVEYSADDYSVFAFKDLKIKRPAGEEDVFYKAGEEIEKKPVRSKLRATDTELLPQFDYFMEQEIFAEVRTTGRLVKLFNGGSNTGKRMRSLLENEELMQKLTQLNKDILENTTFTKQKQVFSKFRESKVADKFYQTVKNKYVPIYKELVKENFEEKYFFSEDKNTFIELLNSKFNKKNLLIAKALDSISEKKDVESFNNQIKFFLNIIEETVKKGRNIYTVACGTSYHATLIGSLFFNEIPNVELIPSLPGDFRGEFSKSLHDGDVLIGVSQSGETKDLINIVNDVEESGYDIKKIVIVNNQNSTLGQEKSDVCVPIYCGPEIAVPATKSFINQIMMFYYLAIQVAKMRIELVENNDDIPAPMDLEKMKQNVKERERTINNIPSLIKETLSNTADEIDYVASKIYIEPSVHILATKITGVALEGALKIRETVLNHTEGKEGSEFKHGPNTILGKNTVFGIKHVKAMVKHFDQIIDKIYKLAAERDISNLEVRKITTALSTYIFKKIYPFNLSEEGLELFKEVTKEYNFFEKGYRNYPIIYVTGPDERDVNLTISQINTHKIRGGDSFIIAEENDKLLLNTKKNPHENDYYGWGYITLPKTGDDLLNTFSATVVLQLLALKMSVRKMKKLDKLGLKDHGVHPDVPKNVSKSITVD